MRLSHEFQNALDDFYALAMTKDNYAERLGKAYKYIYSLENKKIYNLTSKEYEYIINKYRAFIFEIVNGFRTNRIKYYSLNNKDFICNRLRKYYMGYIMRSKNNNVNYCMKRVAKLMRHNKYKYNKNKNISTRCLRYELESLEDAFMWNR